MAKKTAGTKPTGPNAATQGKPLAVHYAQPHEGPIDTPNSNGKWDANSGRVAPVRQAPVKGSRKSF